MEIIIGSILLIFALVSIAISIPHILQMQLSEYLLYKYKGMIKESGYLRSLIPLRFSLPAKSPRNLLIAAFLVLFQLAVGVGLFFLFSANLLLVATAFPIFWLTGKLAVLLGVILTTPLAFLIRYRLIYIAKRQFARSNVEVIGITGSYGKSTVKEIIYRVLSTKFITGKTRGNRNTDVGIAIEASLQVNPATEYFVAEMGAYRKGDISKMCRLYKPKYSILTGVGNQHLSLFGSRIAIMKEKVQILKRFAQNGKGYLNADTADFEDLLKMADRKNIVTYGSSESADAIVSDISNTVGVSNFTVSFSGKEEKYQTKLLGMHNVVNTLPAILLGKELGMKYQEIHDAVKDIDPILGKLSLHTGIKDVTILNDSYNSNVDGFLAAIKVLKGMPQKKKYISTWGVLELGSDKEVSYKLILLALKGSGIHLVTTDKLFASLGLYEDVSVYESEGEVFNRLHDISNEDSIILLEGRHSPEFTKNLGLGRAY